MGNQANRHFISLPSPPREVGDKETFFGKILQYIKDLHRDLENIISLLSNSLNQAVQVSVTSITTDYIINRSEDFLILVDTTFGDVNVGLPSVVSAKNKYFIVKKIDSSGNDVIISGDANIDGAANKSLTTQWQVLGFISNGEEWYTV